MDKSDKGKVKILTKIMILVLIVVAIFLLFQFTPLSISDFTPANVKNFILKYGIWAPIVFIVIYALREPLW